MDKDRDKLPYTPAKVMSRVDRYRPAEKCEHDSSGSKKSDENWEPKKSSAWKWVFRLLVVPMLCILMLYGGMVAGYVVLGHGTVSEALNLETWTHLFRLIFG